MEARLAHPIYDPVRPWMARLGAPTLEGLNALAEEAGLRTESGRAVRFVPPAALRGAYEVNVFETGRVATRPENLHDLFNALAWLAFPRVKARLNALHCAEMPREGARRGRKRDLLTLFDEGGALLECADAELLELLREFRWKELFWQRRSRVRAAMRVVVLGHAVLEKALDPWPGITCKALALAPGGDLDEAAALWLGALPDDATPRLLAALPVFGYPGWFPGNERAEFYDDARYFRPFRRDLPRAAGAP